MCLRGCVKSTGVCEKACACCKISFQVGLGALWDMLTSDLFFFYAMTFPVIVMFLVTITTRKLTQFELICSRGCMYVWMHVCVCVCVSVAAFPTLRVDAHYSTDVVDRHVG